MTPGPDVNPAFIDALRDAARPTTLGELAERGVQRVRTIGTREIAFLIERALNRTLVERTLGKIEPAEMADLSADVEAEFKRQLESVQDLEDSRVLLDRHRREMSEQVTAIRQRIAERESFETQVRALGALQDADALRHFRLQILGCLKPILPKDAGAEERVRTATDDLLELFQAEMARIIAVKSRQVDLDVQQLERRIAKLVANLEETERVLARVSKLKDIDIGIASIYRTVQGLSGEDGSYEVKKELMQAIFLANRKLQEELSRSA